MNKFELVRKIAARTNSTEANAEETLNIILDEIKTHVVHGGVVKLYGFGTFLRLHRERRNGINPQTGKLIKIPAMWTIKFRAAQGFKDAAN